MTSASSTPQYRLIIDVLLARFEQNCNELLAQGYTPQGGLALVRDSGTYAYAQAFILTVK